MNLIYKKADISDIDMLTKTRVQVLRAANMLEDSIDMGEVEKESYNYYAQSIVDRSHIAYMVFDDIRFVGTGGISFYKVMPTYHNPSGQKAYIMNMYTHPDYRRLGIAYHTLDLLVAEAKRRSITAVSLEATDMGKPLYEKFGFVRMKDEMELDR